MGLFSFLRDDNSNVLPVTQSLVASESKKLHILIDALKDNDIDILASPNAIPSFISRENQQLAAEAYAACANYAGNMTMRSIMKGTLGAFPDHKITPIEDSQSIGQAIGRRLLAAGLPPDAYYNGEPLIFAAIAGNGSFNESFVADLCEYGANLNVTNKNGYTPLGAHLKHGRGTIGYKFEPYSNRGVRLNEMEMSDFEVLKTIFECGLYDIAKQIPKAILFEKAREADKHSGPDSGYTLLNYAAGGIQGSLGICLGPKNEIIEKCKKDYFSNNGYPLLVKLLLDCGADPLQKAKNGHDALSSASMCGHNVVFRILVNHVLKNRFESKGAVNGYSNAMGTLLFNASYLGDDESVRSLLEFGADPNSSSFANYPLEKAFAYDLRLPEELINLLRYHTAAVSKHIDVGSRLDLGISNLYYPSLEGNARVVHLLLEAGADPNAISINGLTPLYVAAEIGSLAVVKDLIQHGAEINKLTNKNCTAILNAAEEGQIEVVKYLLENGADPFIRTTYGDNAIDAAIKKGHANIAALMRNYS